MGHVVAALIPIIALVALGSGLQRFGFYDEAFRHHIDKLVYWVALPALLIGKLSLEDPSKLGASTLLLAFVFTTIASIGLGYLVAALAQTSPAERGALVQGGFRSNLAFVGLPVILVVSESSAFAGHALASQALLILAPGALLYNICAVTVLELERNRFDVRVVPRFLRSLAANPLILSCTLGLLLGWMGLELPQPLRQILDFLGRVASPLALLSLGGTLTLRAEGNRFGLIIAGTVIKLVVTPLLAWGIGAWLGLPRESLLILLIFASSPTAVASYVMAAQMGGDERLAASVVVMTTFFAAIPLAVALGFAS